MSALLPDLRARLEALDYDAGLRSALGLAYAMTPPWTRRADLTRALPALPDDLRNAYRLWLLGDTIPREAADAALTAELVDGLIALGLLKAAERGVRARGGLALLAFRGRYLFADDPTASRAVPPKERIYLGNHSYLLAYHLRPTGGDALDLGTGTGFLALQCAGAVERITASDIDDRSVEAATLNVTMNGLADRIAVVKSDLFEGLAGRRFDFICANVPFVPVPPEVSYPAYAAGGEDGLAVVRRVLAALADHLAPGGRCQMLAMSPIRADGARTVDAELDPLRRAGFRCLIQIFDSASVDDTLADNSATVAANLGADVASTRQRWSRHFADKGIVGLAMLLLTLDRPASGTSPGDLRVIGA